MIKSKLIGGMFGLNISKIGTEPPFLNHECSYYLNARSAILDVIYALHPKTVWVPSYLCLIMLDPPKTANVSVRFFPVSKYLQIEENGWISEIKEGDVVIVIDYFGFNSSGWVYEVTRERGAWTLEDASQALLSTHVGKYSDFVVYSPRKFVGVPDGGILWRKAPCSICTDKIMPPAGWWIKAFEACLLRRDFDNSRSKGDKKWFQLGREMEAGMPLGNYDASSLSIAILETAIDWKSVSKKRRDNYMILLSKLSDYAIFKNLPYDVVPLGFPICVNNRDKLQQALFKENIYPAIHWDLKGTVPEKFVESHKLSRNILTLTCDQRYGNEDMERIIQLVKHSL